MERKEDGKYRKKSRYIWNMMKWCDIHVIRVLKRESENRPEAIFEEIMSENFQN